MTDDDHKEAPSRGKASPAVLIALGTFAAANAAAWFHFRRQQPKIDAQTRERLRPRRGA